MAIVDVIDYLRLGGILGLISWLVQNLACFLWNIRTRCLTLGMSGLFSEQVRTSSFVIIYLLSTIFP